MTTSFHKYSKLIFPKEHSRSCTYWLFFNRYYPETGNQSQMAIIRMAADVG